MRGDNSESLNGKLLNYQVLIAKIVYVFQVQKIGTDIYLH